jgi:hypothetical protein
MTLTVAHTTLFDEALFDSPRVRMADPISSHLAADQSAASLPEVRTNIRALLKLHGPMTGAQLNDLYALTSTGMDWSRVSYDSPRKRAAEMAADGLLEVTNEDAKRGIGRVYALAVNA